MARKFSFSHQRLDLNEMHIHFTDTTDALKAYYDPLHPGSVRFIGFSASELKWELDKRLREVETATVFSILSAIEALFRIDYIQRCHKKKKDPISKEFQQIYKAHEYRASLEDDIFSVWKSKFTTPPLLIPALKEAFKYRHWIAHGRYWTPNLGREKYDYPFVFQLAKTVFESFPFEE